MSLFKREDIAASASGVRGLRPVARVLTGLAAVAALAACTHSGPGIQTWDEQLDVRNCKRIAEVSPPVSTAGNFDAAVRHMAASAVLAGGTDLYLRRDKRDWSVVSGVAYDCHGVSRQGAALATTGKVVKD